jgi:SNF2 family DNA or RNA helicase
LFDYNWRRIILDEAHNIKNRNTLMAQGAFNLKSDFKWCLTGTPIQNNDTELYSLFKFLEVETFSEWYWWSKYITNSVSTKNKY